MIRKTIQTIAKYLQAPLHGCSDSDLMIQGVAIDSRKVSNGNLYIPLLGARQDGHSFIESARKMVLQPVFGKRIIYLIQIFP